MFYDFPMRWVIESKKMNKSGDPGPQKNKISLNLMIFMFKKWNRDFIVPKWSRKYIKLPKWQKNIIILLPGDLCVLSNLTQVIHLLRPDDSCPPSRCARYFQMSGLRILNLCRKGCCPSFLYFIGISYGHD